jgi:hypothetical protein
MLLYMYTEGTTDIVQVPFHPLPDDNLIKQPSENEEIEFFECQKCSEYNAIKTKSKKRRTTRIRHIRINSVTWASFKRFAALNNTSLDYALMLLLYNARTPNVNYLVNSKSMVNKK